MTSAGQYRQCLDHRAGAQVVLFRDMDVTATYSTTILAQCVFL